MPANTGRVQDTRFKPGASGNPAGKPKGARNRTTVLLERLIEGEAEEVTQTLINAAKAGDMAAIRLVMDRVLPPRKDRPVTFALPKLERAADVVAANAALVEAVAAGDLTPSEAAELSKVLDGFTRAIEAADIQERLARLEAARSPVS